MPSKLSPSRHVQMCLVQRHELLQRAGRAHLGSEFTRCACRGHLILVGSNVNRMPPVRKIFKSRCRRSSKRRLILAPACEGRYFFLLRDVGFIARALRCWTAFNRAAAVTPTMPLPTDAGRDIKKKQLFTAVETRVRNDQFTDHERSALRKYNLHEGVTISQNRMPIGYAQPMQDIRSNKLNWLKTIAASPTSSRPALEAAAALERKPLPPVGKVVLAPPPANEDFVMLVVGKQGAGSHEQIGQQLLADLQARGHTVTSIVTGSSDSGSVNKAVMSFQTAIKG